jgi:Flp pilus assembly protein TadG
MSNRALPLRRLTGPRRSRGVASVEFAIVAPLLMLTLLATAEIGRALVHYDTLSYAVRNTARYVSMNAIDGTTGVVSLSDVTIARARNLAIRANSTGTGDLVLPNFRADHVTIAAVGDDNIRVTAVYPYQPMIGAVLPTFGIGSGPIPLTFTMRVAVTMRAIS